MPYGGILPFKTDATTPLIADIIVTDFESIKFIHEPVLIGNTANQNQYNFLLTDPNHLNLADDFFDVGTNSYPIFGYDDVANEFTARYYKINTFPKVNALLRLFQLIAKRNIESNKLVQSYFDERLAFTDKLVIVSSGTKYDVSGDK